MKKSNATYEKSIKKNFIMNSFLTMSSLLFPLITFPYVSRILLPVGTGKISFATSLIAYFNIFAQLGIPTYGIRACARVRDDRNQLTKITHELLFINLLMSIISYLILFIAIAFVPRLNEEKILFIIISTTIILSTIGMEWLYKALEQYTYITVRSLIFKLLALAFTFLLIHEESDYIIYGGITIFAASASNIFNFINVHKYINFKLIENYNFKQHIKPIFVFFTMTCATTIYTNLDTVMLGLMLSDIEVGYYNAAVKIKNILITIIASLGTVLLPRVSYYIEKGEFEKFKKMCKKSMNFTIIIAIPLFVYFTFFAKECVLFLSGNTYMNSITPMQIIMPTLVFVGMTNILGTQILVPLGKEKQVLISEIFGAGIDLVLNIILIPKLELIGAAIGTLIAELVVLIIQWISLGKLAFEAYQQIQWIKILISTVFGTIASLWIKFLRFDNFITLFISSCLFFGIYGLFLLLTKEPMVTNIFNQIMNEIIKKFKKC